CPLQGVSASKISAVSGQGLGQRLVDRGGAQAESVLPPVIGLAAGVPPVTVPGMSRLQVLPFRDAHLDAAGALLARRHAVHRRAEPLLAPRYADAAARWVDEDRTAHYAVVPAGAPALVDAWFRLGFGQQQVHGVREPLVPPPPVPDGVAVRHGRPADAAALAPLDLVLPQHQAQ